MEKAEMRRVLLASTLLLVPLVIAGTSRRARAENATQKPSATRNIRQAETEAGNLVVDAIREAGKADIALIPAVVFRTSTRPASLSTAEQATGVLETPEDTLVVITLKGSVLREVLERSVWFAPQPFAGFLHVSGVRFSYDPKAESGSRLKTVTVGDAPLNPAKTYKVAVPAALATGQQGYQKIWGKDVASTAVEKTLTVALQERFAKTSAAPGIEGRIVVVE
jgi:2',3'-cyclic-nucleotide 2'-phosphodiesterase (5'-nucleotidase family)